MKELFQIQFYQRLLGKALNQKTKARENIPGQNFLQRVLGFYSIALR
jgi:hypothetical protein